MTKGVKYWKKKTWTQFSKYIRLRDWANQLDPDPWLAPCISCRKLYPISGKGCLQAGHFITRAKGAILYDEQNVHAQCYNCNLRLKGNWDNYYDNMKLIYGQEAIDDLMQRRFDEANFNPVMLEELYNEITNKLSKLIDKYGNPYK